MVGVKPSVFVSMYVTPLSSCVCICVALGTAVHVAVGEQGNLATDVCPVIVFGFNGLHTQVLRPANGVGGFRSDAPQHSPLWGACALITAIRWIVIHPWIILVYTLHAWA